MDTGSGPDWGQQMAYEARAWAEEYEASTERQTTQTKGRKMGLRTQETKEFELCPAGSFVGRLFRVVDLGTHRDDKWQKLSHLVQFAWELPGKKMADGRPYLVQKRYTLSHHEKSRLRIDLESWYAKKFNTAQLNKAGGFDLAKLVGRPALLTIAHSDDGKFANVVGISPLPEGVECPPAINPTFVFEIEQWGQPSAMAGLSDKQREFIGQAEELNKRQQREPGADEIESDRPWESSSTDADSESVPF